MSKNIEIEQRGPLSQEQLASVKKLFSEKGTFVEKKDRVLIDYSTFIPGEEIAGRTRDIRIRCTNGIPEIVIKLGAWGGAEARKELSFKGAPGNFDTLAQIFGALNLRKGILCVRKSEVYTYKGIEFALVEVPNHSMYFEAEILAESEATKDAAIAEIGSVCAELGLSIYSQADYFAYIDRLNKESNEVFEYANYTDGYFKKRFGI